MDEERIKSAFEIAMERIAGLPELTPQEIAAQKEKQYGPVGEALAARFLNHLINEHELAAELGKYLSDQKRIIWNALVSSLSRTMQLGGAMSTFQRAVTGLIQISIEKKAVAEQIVRTYVSIVTEFTAEIEKRSADLEQAALKPLGISGSAVRCNPAENVSYLKEVELLKNEYEPRVQALRAALETAFRTA